jgi:hypothetical protein
MIMEQVIKYKAKDGVEFDTDYDATNYENLLDRLERVRSVINEQENSNSDIGVENTQEAIDEFNETFRHILVDAAPELVEKWDANPRGIIGRYLSDGDSAIYNALDRAYYRCVLCVGNNNKSYGQPYYANHS